jgi:hypothetical protein
MGGHDLPLDNSAMVARLHDERRASVVNVEADAADYEQRRKRCLRCRSWDPFLPAADGNPYRLGGCAHGPWHEDDVICRAFFPLWPPTGC